MIIGITGTLGAGKGTVVEYLVRKKGFRHFSVREFLIKEIHRRGLPVNRDTMASVANDLRAARGASFIVEELFAEAQKTGGTAIIESLRAVGEVEALQKKGDFYLLAVDADPNVRYERIARRGSETDRVSFEKFLQDERREMESDDPAKQNLARCIARADYQCANNGTVEELEEQVENIVEQITRMSRSAS